MSLAVKHLGLHCAVTSIQPKVSLNGDTSPPFPQHNRTLLLPTFVLLPHLSIYAQESKEEALFKLQCVVILAYPGLKTLLLLPCETPSAAFMGGRELYECHT